MADHEEWRPRPKWRRCVGRHMAVAVRIKEASLRWQARRSTAASGQLGPRTSAAASSTPCLTPLSPLAHGMLLQSQPPTSWQEAHQKESRHRMAMAAGRVARPRLHQLAAPLPQGGASRNTNTLANGTRGCRSPLMPLSSTRCCARDHYPNPTTLQRGALPPYIGGQLPPTYSIQHHPFATLQETRECRQSRIRKVIPTTVAKMQLSWRR